MLTIIFHLSDFFSLLNMILYSLNYFKVNDSNQIEMKAQEDLQDDGTGQMEIFESITNSQMENLESQGGTKNTFASQLEEIIAIIRRR